MAFASTIEMGITDRGNRDFFISDRSLTIDEAALDSEREKKFHVSNPVKR